MIIEIFFTGSFILFGILKWVNLLMNSKKNIGIFFKIRPIDNTTRGNGMWQNYLCYPGNKMLNLCLNS